MQLTLPQSKLVAESLTPKFDPEPQQTLRRKIKEQKTSSCFAENKVKSCLNPNIAF
jgi:hypothetical protein